MKIPPRVEGLRDFRNFLYLVYKFKGWDVPTATQDDIAHFLQHGPKRVLVEAFRGVGKSAITTAFVCWCLYWHPEWNILVVSASKQRADEFTTFAKEILAGIPELRWLAPTSKSARNSMVSFDVGPVAGTAPQFPSVKSCGLFGMITGSRANLIIADDVEIPNNSETQHMREKLAERIQEFSAILLPREDSRIVFLGTPQTEASIYNGLPAKGYETRIWPVRYPTEKQLVHYRGNLAPLFLDALREDPKLAGQPSDRRFPELDLQERQADYGRSGFALQFMLDTSLADANRYPLKVSDLIVMALNPETAPEHPVWASSPELVVRDLENVAFDGDRFYRPMAIQGDWLPYQGSVLAIDPSGRGKDETGYAVVKMLNGYLYVTECGGLDGGYSEETLEKLAEIAKRNRVNHIVVEENFGDGMFSQLFKPILRQVWPCHVEEVKHSRQKELRIIDTLEPVMNQHKLVFDEKVLRADTKISEEVSPEQATKYRLVYQMTRLTKDRGALVHDDRLDALSMAVNYWTTHMGRDVEEAKKQHREEQIEKALRAFRERAVFGNQSEPNRFIRA